MSISAIDLLRLVLVIVWVKVSTKSFQLRGSFSLRRSSVTCWAAEMVRPNSSGVICWISVSSMAALGLRGTVEAGSLYLTVNSSKEG